MKSEGMTKLKTLEKVGYASGDLACNLIFATVTSYLLFFYTEIFGLAPAAVAVMFLVVRIFDAVNDPIMGIVVDKTNTRYGRFRPYILFGAIPFAVIAILAFMTPDLSPMGRLVYAYVTYMGLSLAYTVVNIPYGALTPAMTNDGDEIVSLTSFRMFFANLGGLIIAFFVPFLSGIITEHTESAARGWQYTITIFAVLGAALLIFCFKNTKERIKPDVATKIHFKDIFEQFKVNRPLLVLSAIFILIFGVNSIAGSMSVFFVTFNMDRPDLVHWYMLANTLPAFVVLPLLPKLTKVLGRKGILYWAIALSIVGILALYFAPVHNVPVVFITRIVASMGTLLVGGYIWALIPETIEYGYQKTGKRLNGLIYAVIGFFFKFGMAVGGIVPGLVLEHFGYVANQAQTPRALQGIMIVYTIIPAILLAVVMVVFKSYNVNDSQEIAVKTEKASNPALSKMEKAQV
ncbi:MAG: MFS transporter [Turicibacter sp.]|nr:MFS transporter [Turicibacter sp.]